MIIQGAMPYQSDKEKDNLVKGLKTEFNYKVKISVDRINKIISYTNYYSDRKLGVA